MPAFRWFSSQNEIRSRTNERFHALKRSWELNWGLKSVGSILKSQSLKYLNISIENMTLFQIFLLKIRNCFSQWHSAVRTVSFKKTQPFNRNVFVIISLIMVNWGEFTGWHHDGENWSSKFLAKLCDRVLLSIQVAYGPSNRQLASHNLLYIENEQMWVLDWGSRSQACDAPM